MRTWSSDQVGDLMRAFQKAAILGAGAELDVFGQLGAGPLAADELAGRIGGDLRATRILADALTAMGLLGKQDGRYSLAPGVGDALTEGGSHKVLGMTRHQAVMMRRWAQLANVVKAGKPPARQPSTRGADGDERSFIEAMAEISAPNAGSLIESLGELEFSCVLDVGGASGTYAAAFLNRYPRSRGIIFDLPTVIPMAIERMTGAGLKDRVDFVGGDMLSDPLPGGSDLIWISAIIHMLSRDDSRLLYRKSYDALPAGGQVLVRDIVMDDAHLQPPSGAIFAINMLTGTAGGGTYSLSEIRSDLESAGFQDVRQLRQDAWMDSVVAAKK